MDRWIPFWPQTAAISAQRVEAVFVAELILSLVIFGTVAAMMLVFCTRYRATREERRDDMPAHLATSSWRLEIGWTSATLALFLGLFVWGAGVYVWLYQAPHGDEDIYVTGKRWMWKVEHPGGQREINTLHVPVDKKIRLTMASEDVIHSFYVPAFRLKHDVVPGTLETLWFQADKTGTFQLACTQFCGLDHARMRGEVIVMSGPDYARWLTEQGVSPSLAEQGAGLFHAHGCSGCHGVNSTVHAPSLVGLYGTMVNLEDETVRLADDAYIRDCILNPRSFNVAGYAPLMPDFSGQLSEGEVLKLIAYIKSLASPQEKSR